jgi:enoyl-CoA hydratase
MITTSDPRIAIHIDNAVAIVTINRPEKLNALDSEMMHALANLCQQIEHDDSVRIVLLTGAGGKSFCAGGDIDAWSALPADAFGRFWIREGNDTFDRIARLRQPIIAILNGHTLGGGLELAACADYRIAEAQVKIGQPESGIGIIPGWSGTQRLVRRFGAGVVRRMAMFGDVFDADYALQLGLVDQLVEEGGGMAAGLALAATVNTRGPRATELTKMLINVAEGEETGRVLEAIAGTLAADSAQLREGISAFRDKRKPQY